MPKNGQDFFRIGQVPIDMHSEASSTPYATTDLLLAQHEGARPGLCTDYKAHQFSITPGFDLIFVGKQSRPCRPTPFRP